MTRSGISRRVLMRGGAVAGLALAAGGAQAFGPPTGTLRVAVPALSGRGLSAALLGPGTVAETLTDISATGELLPELATGWQAAEGGRVWTFHIRQDARFADGRPFVAEAVADALGAEVAGPGSVVFRMDTPDLELPFRLADPARAVRVDGLGSGPYLPEREGERTVRLSRRAEHWRDGTGAWFDGVLVTAMADPADRLTALKRGEIDATPLTAAEVPILERSRGLRWARAPGHQQIVMDCGSAAMATALSPAIDRDTLLAEGLGGFGRPADSPPFDAFAARAGIARAGLTGVRVTLEPSAGTPPMLVAALARQLTDSGLDTGTGGIPLRLWRSSGRMTPGWAADHLAAQGDPAQLLLPAFPDMILGYSARLVRPETLGGRHDLDDGRIALRWAFA